MPSREGLLALRALLAAECAAEAPAAGVDPADLEQEVWVRLLDRAARRDPEGVGHPADPARLLRHTVRAAARSARRRARREVGYGPRGADRLGTPVGDDGGGVEQGVEARVLAAEQRRALRAAVGRLPGRCPRLLSALLSGQDPTYAEIARALGISQGSLGPVRSRCLQCLRRMLVAEFAAGDCRSRPRGKER